MFEQYKEWETDRLGKITASEIWKIMEKGRGGEYFGKGAQTYIRQKAAEILTLEPVNGGRVNINALEWGNANENDAIEEFKKRLKINVTAYGGQSPKFFEYTPFCGGSPDGITEHGEVIEVKCPFNSAEHIQHLLLTDWQELKSYAPEYYWQITANMLFTGSTAAYFISYDYRFADEHLRLKTIDFDLQQEDVELLKERIAEAEKQLSMLIELIRG